MAKAVAIARMRRITLATGAAVVALDATSKVLAVHLLSGRPPITILGGALRLDLYRNFAGPGNTFEGRPILVSALAIVAVALIAALATRARTRSAAVAVGLLLGGGVGNLLDRLVRAPGPLRGGVIDWLKPGWSSGSMNLADLAILAAIVVFGLGAMIDWWSKRSPLQDNGSPIASNGH